MARTNHRHPMALQAEVKRRLFAEGKIDKHGNKIVKGGSAPPPPPPPSKPSTNMVTSGSTVARKPGATSKPIVLSPREKLEALPDAEIVAKAKTLNLNTAGAGREKLIEALLKAGAEG